MRSFLMPAIFTLYFLPGNCQVSSPAGRQFSNLLQIDSSEFYVTGTSVDKTNKSQFVGRQFGLAGNFWTNLYIFNSNTKRTTKLFSQSPIAISPIQNNEISSGRFESLQKGTYYSTIRARHIILLVKTDEFLKNGLIDEDDPTSIFICTVSGQELARVSPLDFNVTAWRLSKDNQMLFITGQHDKNGDKEFAAEDEMIYEVDLSKGISNIKLKALDF